MLFSFDQLLVVLAGPDLSIANSSNASPKASPNGRRIGNVQAGDRLHQGLRAGSGTPAAGRTEPNSQPLNLGVASNGPPLRGRRERGEADAGHSVIQTMS